ncbi:MAG: PAS domain-containing sensor histidine kinase, partial [Kiritimatiellia bacterium]|nr:PAS domain-containing sensor histidine kinase [Kiritimatiellia bacterium]
TDEELQATIEIGFHEHEVEVKLKQSKEEYRRLFDNAPVGYHEIDLKGNLVRVNRTESEMLGYAESDMVGQPVWDFAEEHSVAREAVMEKLSIGKISSQPFERNYLRRNGRPIPVLIKDFPVRSDDGKLLGIRSTIQDISVLKEEQARTVGFFAITEKSMSGIIVTDHKGSPHYLNPAAEELLGLRAAIALSPRRSLPGRAPWPTQVVSGRRADRRSLGRDGEAAQPGRNRSALKDADTKSALPVIVEKAPDGMAIAGQKEVMRRMGAVLKRILRHKKDDLLGDKLDMPIEYYTREIGIARVADSGPGTGEVRVAHTTWEEKPAYLISIYDVTERKKVEEELRKIDQMKTNFISVVSHELRTPLAIIKEGLSLVLDKIPGQINEKQEIILAASKNNIDRLARIINEILNISKIEAGEIGLKTELVNIADKVSEVVASFTARVNDKGLELKTSFSSPAINIHVDPDKIIQIFTNLINNALKFTDKGCIRIRIKELENEVECLVADTGIGIPENDLPKVFSKFQQFDRIDGPGEKGTGLGLSIVKDLVEMHKGKIRVDSQRGSGTKFTFTFPKNITKDNPKKSEKKQQRKLAKKNE